MSIETTYRRIFVEQYLRDQISRGITVYASDIKAELGTLIQEQDLSVPQFEAADNHTSYGENSSATKHLATFGDILQDLTTLYSETLNLTESATNAFERWKLESEGLERRLIALEDRIENLLLMTQGT